MRFRVSLFQIGQVYSVLVTETATDGIHYVGHNKSYEQVAGGCAVVLMAPDPSAIAARHSWPRCRCAHHRRRQVLHGGRAAGRYGAARFANCNPPGSSNGGGGGGGASGPRWF